MKHASRFTTIVTLLAALSLLITTSVSATARASQALQNSETPVPTVGAPSGDESKDDETQKDSSGGWFDNAVDTVIDTGGDVVGGAKDTTVSAADTVWDTAEQAPGAVWGVANDGWNWLRDTSSESITWEGWAAFLVDHPVLGTLLGPLVLLVTGLSPDGSISYLDIGLTGLLLLIPAVKGIQVIREIVAPLVPRLSRGEDIVGTMRRIPAVLQLDPADMLAFLRARTIQPTLDVIAKLPKSPGVYVVLDTEGTPIYVGKSNSIQRRLTEHFTPPRSQFADEAASIKLIPRKSVTDALALECRLIKGFRPTYNVVHNNDLPCPIFVEVLTPVRP